VAHEPPRSTPQSRPVALLSLETPLPNVAADIEQDHRIRLKASNRQCRDAASWSRIIPCVAWRKPLFTQRKFEVYEFWPGDFFALFEQAGISRRVPPPFLPETGSELASRAGQKPIIISPNSKESLFVSTKTIPLRAKADAAVREIFWFAGKQFVGKAAPNQVLEWTATATDYEVTALDDHSRAGWHSVVVR